MAPINISLPDAFKQWVENRTEDGTYANSSDYVRDLIRRDCERSQKISAIQIMVDEARAGGVSTKSMDDIWAGVGGKIG